MFEISSGVMYSGVTGKQPEARHSPLGDGLMYDGAEGQATIIAMGVIVGLWWFAMIMICVATGNI